MADNSGKARQTSQNVNSVNVFAETIIGPQNAFYQCDV